MEDLAASATSVLSATTTTTTCDTTQHSLASHLHPKQLANLYKKRTNASSQEERRKAILSEQKKKRQSLIESNRGDFSSPEIKRDEKAKKQGSPRSAQFMERTIERFSNQLMYSEWLEEVPQDFDTNWIMVMCPVGKRCLVVASEGFTSVYNKAGKLIARHTSRLPGGSRDSKIDETILDCVYNDFLRTYFIIDCLCWKSHPILDTETEFRFYWLKCKLDETRGLDDWSHENPYVFKDVSRTYPLSPKSIWNQLELDFNKEPKIDGVLFYHKETHYTPGFTPLVGWLKPYMLPEILNIPVPSKIIDSTPSDYLNAKQAIETETKSRSNLTRQVLISDLNHCGNSADEDTMSDDTATGDETSSAALSRLFS